MFMKRKQQRHYGDNKAFVATTDGSTCEIDLNEVTFDALLETLRKRKMQGRIMTFRHGDPFYTDFDFSQQPTATS